MKTIEKDDVLILKGTIRRKHKRMLFPNVDCFVDETKSTKL